MWFREFASFPIRVAFVTFAVVAHGYGWAATPLWCDEQEIDFARDVQPIFAEHCQHCHGRDIQESNYRLDVRSSGLGPGDIGQPPVVPGDSSRSALISYVSGDDPDLLMPPEGESERLSDEQINILKRWIDEGALWPDDLAGDTEPASPSTWWSLQPVQKSNPKHSDFENEIDSFVFEKLKKNLLDFSPPADRRTLIRRLFLGLHGLPPTEEQTSAFLQDSSEDAWARVVDEALQSPRYGESWARHWLDVVRFGESTGYEVNRDRANAYFYRDYVIDSLNADKPFRQFIIEQIAGDAVGVDAATGFLVGGPYDTVKSPDINLTLMQRQDELADIVNTTSMTFLAMTVGCARCHNHKFDPITQTDYFSLQAIFSGVRHGERKMHSMIPQDQKDAIDQLAESIKYLEAKLTRIRKSHASVEPSKELKPAVIAKLNEETFAPLTASRVRFTIRATNIHEPCIDELEVFAESSDENVALRNSGATATSSGDYSGNPIHQLNHINDGMYGNSHSWISNTVGTGWVQIDFDKPVTIDRIRWGRDREEQYSDRLAVSYEITVSHEDPNQWVVVASSDDRKPFLEKGQEPLDAFIARLPEAEKEHARGIANEINQMRQSRMELEQSVPVGYVGNFVAAEPVYRLFRGDPMSPRELVAPGGIDSVGSLELPGSTAEQDRRIELANWIASDENPLTARVIVNRVWHYHFGQGIVTTPSDFGKNGGLPSHPELLDFLASEFMSNGWSLKWLHRKIVTSKTYQQSSRPNADALAVDSDCRLLWRFPPRRMTAESIRDCVLAVTGKLNHAGGGPGFLLFEIDRENVHHYFPIQEFGPEQFRRMVYMTKIRQEQDDVFGAFDCPDGGQAIANRSRSTTPLQALNLLNSNFMLEQSDAFAKRLQASADSLNQQIELAYQLAYSRPPEQDELQDAVDFAEQYGLPAFCRAILNSNEFLFLN